MVFGAVTGFGLALEPHVWQEKEKIDSAKYMKMLDEKIFPELREKNPLHPGSLEGYIWMQVWNHSLRLAEQRTACCHFLHDCLLFACCMFVRMVQASIPVMRCMS